MGRWFWGYGATVFVTICAGMFAAVSWIFGDLRSAGVGGAVAAVGVIVWGGFEYVAEWDRERQARQDTVL